MSCISKHISIQQAIMVVEFLQRSTGVRRKYKEGWFCCLIPRLHDTTGCQTSCQTGVTTGLTTVLNEQLFVQPVIKPGCTTGLTTGLHDTAGCQTRLTTGWMFVYTIQPVVKPVGQPVWQQDWQPVVSCIQTFTRSSTTGCIV